MIITIANTKGGVGKTYLAVILSQLLARNKAKTVCAISFDRNGCQHFLLDEDNKPVFDRVSVVESLDKLPHIMNLNSYNSYDYVVMDMPPALSEKDIAEAALLSNSIVIPFTLDNHAIIQAHRVYDKVLAEAEAEAKHRDVLINFAAVIESISSRYEKQLLKFAEETLPKPFLQLPLRRKICANFDELKPFDFGAPNSDDVVWSLFEHTALGEISIQERS